MSIQPIKPGLADDEPRAMMLLFAEALLVDFGILILGFVLGVWAMWSIG